MKPEIKIGMQYTRYIAKSVLKALDYLHGRNIVHRDLGTWSIYMVKNGNDFFFRKHILPNPTLKTFRNRESWKLCHPP